MNKEFLKMQKLAGLITENQFREKVTENKEFDVSQAYDNSPDTHSYNDILGVVKDYDSDDAIESFEKSFSSDELVTKGAWEEWSRTLDGGYDPEGYVYLNWISLTDPDIYTKAGV